MTTSDHGGYVFKAFAEASGTIALARLRGKVRQGLAQRFLIKDGAKVEMPFECIRSRVDCEGVVVDGRLVTWDEFLELLQPYEGWEFDLRIPLEPDWRQTPVGPVASVRADLPGPQRCRRASAGARC